MKMSRPLVRLVVAMSLGLIAGAVSPFFLRSILPMSNAGMPYAEIAASFAINLGGLVLLLAWLPPALNRNGDVPWAAKWAHLRAWASAALVSAAAHAGLWLAPGDSESPRTFAVLWSLFAAQAALLAAAHALLSVLFNGCNWMAKQSCLVILTLAVTALFWSKAPILSASRAGSGVSPLPRQLTDGVMKLSPPLALAGTWYQESGAARSPGRSNAPRFDLIRGTLTYNVWIGSYQAAAYPDIWPSFDGATPEERRFIPGIVLAMLLWSLPLLVLVDVLLLRGEIR